MKLFLLISIFILSLNAKDYNQDENTIEFINMLEEKYSFDKADLEKLFNDVKIQKIPLKLYSQEYKVKKDTEEKTTYGTWDKYVKLKVTQKRINQGVAFLDRYRSTFDRVEKLFGVPAEYVAAIIGIETQYGNDVGNFPVFDTLTTLAFEKNRRNNFFKKQLEEFIVLSFKYKINPKNVKGSYAGAIGLGQFMPSSYKEYGIDLNNDGKVSLLHPHDAIASVANYLKRHGWESDKAVATRVSYEGNRFDRYDTGYKIEYDRRDLKGIRPKYGKWDYKDKVRLIKLNRKKYDELWYGTKNFFVITRYNKSDYYAMSVHKLAQKIKEKRKDKL